MIDRVKRRPRRAILVHAVRLALVIALLWLIPAPSRDKSADSAAAPAVEFAKAGLDGEGLRVVSAQDGNGMWRVVDDSDETVALLARTLPAAEKVVGYRGPTEASLVLNPDLSIQHVDLLTSGDTQEHVEAVMRDEPFFRQFIGWPWGGPSGRIEVDAVSGATLTSLALAEGVLTRMGGARPSLVFPQPLRTDELSDWFPNAASFDEETGRVADQQGQTLGRVIRSGPLVDDVIGYQGPTEVLLKLSESSDGQVVDSIRLRRSFDNEPYVDYVRVERGFWKIFTSKTLTELAELDLLEARVEGVSGATMTSLAVADTIVEAAKVAEQTERSQPSPKSSPLASIRWTRADGATACVLLAVVLLLRHHWFHLGWPRRVWLLAVIVLIGFWSGNLISMALIAGWSAEGVAWRLAPGLAAVAAVTLLVPPVSKGNPYCNHLCPHGAIQQLIKPSPHARRRWTFSPTLHRWLRRLPGTTLAAAYVLLIVSPEVDLASWEPFHAYLFRIAPWGSLGLAVASLLIATVIPMGYCRYGCPTGTLIDYLRRTAISDRVQKSDWVAAGLLVFAIAVRQFDRFI